MWAQDVDINGQKYNLEDVCIIDQAKMRSGNTGQIPVRFDGPLMKMKPYDNSSPEISNFF